MSSEWRVDLGKVTLRELRKCPRHDARRIILALREMEADPFAGDIVYLTAHESDYRRRVGDWRIFFSLHKTEKIVVVDHIRRRTSNTY
jgi:mRNA interferase RelE/StbE